MLPSKNTQIFFENWASKRLSNFIVFLIHFVIDVGSVLALSWPPTWIHLKGQDNLKSEKLASDKSSAAPQERLWIQPCFWRPFKNLLASMFGGSGLDCQRVWDDFFELPGLLWTCFRLLLLGGYAPPDPPGSTNFERKSQTILQPICQRIQNLPQMKPKTKCGQTPTRNLRP